MNVSKPKTLKLLRNSVCAASMMVALNACLPDDSASTNYETQQEFVQAQSEYYANAISQYALQSQHALTNSTAYLSGSIADGTLDLTSAAFGALDLGGAELIVESAFCKTGTDTAKHYTWYSSADENGDFFIKGVGAGHTGYIIAALQDYVNIDTLGIYSNNEITMETGGSTQSIASSCSSLNIPEGAPVIITDIDLPTGVAGDMQRYEYRTLSCNAGDTGSIQQQLLVTYSSDGSVTAGGVTVAAGTDISQDNTLPWATVIDSCTTPVNTATFESTVGMTSSGIDFSAMVSPASGGSTLATLSGTLNNMECRELIETASTMADQTQAQQMLFDTCGIEIEVAAISSIAISDAILTSTEVVTQECDAWLGGATTFEDSVNGDLGLAAADAWTGSVILEREIWTYTVNTSGGPVGPGCGDCEETTSVDVWRGLQIECSRYEQLTIECETRLPQYSDTSVYTPIDDGGFVYDRSNNVSGWADPEEGIPNAPQNPSWTGFSYNCSWNKEGRFGCADFAAFQDMDQLQEGIANRLLEVINIGGSVDVGDWVVAQVARCSEDETWDCSPVPGSEQIRAGGGDRIVEITNPDGTFTDTGLVVDQTALCRKTKEFTCPAGVLRQTGVQERFWEVVDANGTVDDSDDWSTIQNSICDDSRETFGCEQRVEQRTYTGTEPYVGSWTAWTTVSLIDNCGGSGGSGGGSDVCIMAGAQVAMADGTTKDIALLEVGDVTIAGRVMQKFARHYDERNHMTEAGRLMTGEGLFNVDGIVGTGRHAFLSTKGWVELSDAKEAQIVSHDVAMLYNAVMENHILPLVGASGEVYYYADEMNNLGGLSERAMARLMAAENIKLAA